MVFDAIEFANPMLHCPWCGSIIESPSRIDEAVIDFMADMKEIPATTAMIAELRYFLDERNIIIREEPSGWVVGRNHEPFPRLPKFTRYHYPSERTLQGLARRGLIVIIGRFVGGGVAERARITTAGRELLAALAAAKVNA